MGLRVGGLGFTALGLKVFGLRFKPLIWAAKPFTGILGTREGTYRVYTRYVRMQQLGAHAWGPWFQPLDAD